MDSEFLKGIYLNTPPSCRCNARYASDLDRHCYTAEIASHELGGNSYKHGTPSLTDARDIPPSQSSVS